MTIAARWRVSAWPQKNHARRLIARTHGRPLRLGVERPGTWNLRTSRDASRLSQTPNSHSFKSCLQSDRVTNWGDFSYELPWDCKNSIGDAETIEPTDQNRIMNLPLCGTPQIMSRILF